MQLDQTRIAIRERNLPAILDLGLHVVRAHAGAWLFWLTVGALPMLLLDFGVLAALPEPEDPEQYLGVAALLAILVVWQLPLATAPLTLYLGQAVFAQRPSARKVLGALRQAWPQLAWYQGICRGALAPWGLSWFFLFASRQFLNEVILLERTPLRSLKKGALSTSRRAWALHAGVQGELFVRWIMTLLFGVLLLGALYLSLVTLGESLFGWEWQHWRWRTMLLVFLLVLWVVLGYFTVVRFLAYVDLRIRREGWEVELLMRAEAARLSSRCV